MMDDPTMVWMLTNGSAKADAPLLDPQRLIPFETYSPSSRAADQTHVFSIKQTEVTTWVINMTPYQEPKVPIIYGTKSDGWKANTTIHVPSNSVIDIIMKVANDSMDTVCHPLV